MLRGKIFHYLHNGNYAKWLNPIHCMKDKLQKVKKKRINWREFLFHLHNKYLSDRYTLALGKYKKMSHNRLAYYVLKKYFTTSTLKFLRNMFQNTTLTEEGVAEWYRFYCRAGLKEDVVLSSNTSSGFRFESVE